MSKNVDDALYQLSELGGFVAAAVAHSESGMALATSEVGKGFNIEVAVAVNSEVVKAKLRAMNALNITGHIEDILITLDTQYHLIRPLQSNPSAFFYLALDRKGSNLALARMKLGEVEKGLVV